MKLVNRATDPMFKIHRIMFHSEDNGKVIANAQINNSERKPFFLKKQFRFLDILYSGKSPQQTEPVEIIIYTLNLKLVNRAIDSMFQIYRSIVLCSILKITETLF